MAAHDHIRQPDKAPSLCLCQKVLELGYCLCLPGEAGLKKNYPIAQLNDRERTEFSQLWCFRFPCCPELRRCVTSVTRRTCPGGRPIFFSTSASDG